MEHESRILLLEDSPQDAEFVRRELQRGGVVFNLCRVDTEEAFVDKLEKFGPDLVIADYLLPSFDGLRALALVRERSPNLPFILVSGYIGEERAAEALRSGATDFLLKHNLGNRLALAVRRAMREFEEYAERKRAEEMLQQAQKMEVIGQLTGGLAHDFNNLLAVVIGNLDLLEKELGANPKARELAELALKASLRGADLTRKLLAFSRRQTLSPKVIDLNETVSGTTTLLRRTLGETIEVELKLAEGLWPTLADPAQVESALTNLAINARDAMEKGGTLTIETANKHLDEHYAAENPEIVPGDYAMLAVTDTGTGIPPEVLGRVFEPFFTTKGAGKGTGLGLSMVYGFVKQSGGHVKIYSEAGYGTTVRLYLPRSQEAIAQLPAPVPAAGVPRSATILVVEDNPDVRNVVVKQLLALGHRVEQADNAAAALALLKENGSIDLLFTDIVLPGGVAGTDLALEAKKLRPGIKVLLTSGFAEAAMQNAAEFPEGLELLSKPYRQVDLARKILHVLGRG